MQTLSSTKTQSWLSWFFRGILILGFLIVLGRLIDLQIIRGKYFRLLSEGNRIRVLPMVAPRGNILARGGELIAGNKQETRWVSFDKEEGFMKFDTPQEQSEEISEWIREYKWSGDFAHISGYIGEVNSEELGKIRGLCPEKGARNLGALVGRGGLEEEYDCLLSGVDGAELVEVDATGLKVRTLGKKPPLAGSDIKTTVHFGLQKKIAEIMKGKAGSVVVTDTNGQVLALYSTPSFDPNVFVTGASSDKVNKLLNDKGLPLLNRVIGGKYHPGSVVKPIVSVAALEEGVIDENFVYEDTGAITIQSPYGTFSYTNWYFTQYGGTEGKIGLTKAIARSTDTFFYKVGELVGIDKLVVWMQKFGLDKQTEIDIPGEISGLVPTPEWKLKAKGERWFLGNTYHISIGQGDIALTPLGINTAISVIAAQGVYCTPHLVVETGSGNFQFPISNFQCKNLGIGEKNIDLVKEGMKGACSYGGTGFTFFDFRQKTGIDVACKTGTAETEQGEPHSWFTAFAPPDNPEIVVTVLIEHGGEGSRVAGPIAREIFDYWFVEGESTQIKQMGTD